MKRILFIVSLFFTLKGIGQLPVVPRSNGSIYIQDFRVFPKLNFVLPPYLDTAAANAAGAIGNNLVGSKIYTISDNKEWIRKGVGGTAGVYWQESGGGGSGTVTGAINGNTLVGANISWGGRLTGNTIISAAGTNDITFDSLSNTRFVTRGIKKIQLTSTNLSDSAFVYVERAALGVVNNASIGVYGGSTAITANVLASNTTTVDNPNIKFQNTQGVRFTNWLLADTSHLQLYSVRGSSNANTSYIELYPDSAILWKGDRSSGLGIYESHADQWANDSLIWRITNRSADFFLSPNFAKIYSDDSIVLESETGYYRFTDMLSTIDTTTYKPGVFDINGKLRRGNSWAQFGAKSFANGIYDSSGIVGWGAGVNNKSTFNSWRYVNTNGNREYRTSGTSSLLLWVDSSLAGGGAFSTWKGPYGGAFNFESTGPDRTFNGFSWYKSGSFRGTIGHDVDSAGNTNHLFFDDSHDANGWRSYNFEFGGLSSLVMYKTGITYAGLIGAKRFRIGSAAVPGQTLSVTGSVSVTDTATFSGSTHAIIVPSGVGNVGIGVSSPTSIIKLHVVADAGLIAIGGFSTSGGPGLYGETSNASGVQGIHTATGGVGVLGSATAVVADNTGGMFIAQNGTNSNVALTVPTASGRVGFGTVTPATQFHNVGTVRLASLGTASIDTTTYKPLAIDATGNVFPFNSWAQGMPIPTLQQIYAKSNFAPVLTNSTLTDISNKNYQISGANIYNRFNDSANTITMGAGIITLNPENPTATKGLFINNLTVGGAADRLLVGNSSTGRVDFGSNGYGLSFTSSVLLVDSTKFPDKAQANVISGSWNFTTAPKFSTLTANQVMFAGAAGVVTGSANMVFASNELLLNGITDGGAYPLQVAGSVFLKAASGVTALHIEYTAGSTIYWESQVDGSGNVIHNSQGADAIFRRSGSNIFTYSASAVTTVSGIGLTLGAGTTTVSPLTFTSGTNKTTPATGNVEYDGTQLYETNSTAVRGSVQVMRNQTSSAGTLTLAFTYSDYVFTGTTSTWTLPAVTATNHSFFLKNAGSGTVTINSSGGGNDIYNTSAVNTYALTAGSAVILRQIGSIFYVE